MFSDAINHVDGKPQAGETVDVLAVNGKLLGRGGFSPASQIAVRMWTYDGHEPVTTDFFKRRLEAALKLRRALGFMGERTACRLVNAESDGLPGLIVDRYGEFLVCQFVACGAERWKKEIVALLAGLIPCAGIYERSDVDVREKEGLPSVTGVLHGQEPPPLVEVEEGGCRFLVDVRNGHKTGFYLDQRDNRALVGAFSKGAEVLNCFSYTGGFGIYAAKGGAAKVTNIDSSADSLGLGARIAELNGIAADVIENVEGDVFQLLRRYRDSRRTFDVIVLDPPKFVGSRNQLEQASRGYKDINLLAFKLLRPGGCLFTFSCSGLMPADLFQKIVADSALDAGKDGRIIRHMTQGADHPTFLSFPEGSYLKGLVCAVE